MREHLFARTVRGIEWIAAAEIARAATVGELGHREVHFEATVSPALLALGTVDDVFISLGSIQGVGHTKEALSVLEDAAASLDLGRAMGARAVAGATSGPKDLEIVASFLGKRNYNRYDIEEAVGRGLTGSSGLPTLSRRGGTPVRGDLTVRVHIRDDEAIVGVRLGDEPLHRRAWKTESAPGSLHPPVARAMVKLAGARTILDPFCGSGTIPIEAVVMGARGFGADIDTTAIQTAKRNAARAGAGVGWVVADAMRAPFERAEAVVTNVPWGRAAALQGDPKKAWRALGSLGETVVVLTEEEPPKDFAVTQTLSLMGAHPTICGTSLPEELAFWRARARDASLV